MTIDNEPSEGSFPSKRCFEEQNSRENDILQEKLVQSALANEFNREKIIQKIQFKPKDEFLFGDKTTKATTIVKQRSTEPDASIASSGMETKRRSRVLKVNKLTILSPNTNLKILIPPLVVKGRQFSKKNSERFEDSIPNNNQKNNKITSLREINSLKRVKSLENNVHQVQEIKTLHMKPQFHHFSKMVKQNQCKTEGLSTYRTEIYSTRYSRKPLNKRQVKNQPRNYRHLDKLTSFERKFPEIEINHKKEKVQRKSVSKTHKMAKKGYVVASQTPYFNKEFFNTHTNIDQITNLKKSTVSRRKKTRHIPLLSHSQT